MSGMQDVATGLGPECELVGRLSWQVGFLCKADVDKRADSLSMPGPLGVNLRPSTHRLGNDCLPLSCGRIVAAPRTVGQCH